MSDDNPSTGCGSPGCSPCEFAHAQARCLELACAPGACEAGWVDCDGVRENGCETARQTGASACGCHAYDVAPQTVHFRATNLDLIAPREPLTFEAWIIARELEESAAYLFHLGDGTTHQTGVLNMHITDDRRVVCAITSDQATTSLVDAISTLGSLDRTRWAHVACVLDDGHLSIYLDGRPEGTAPIRTTRVPSQTLTLGSPLLPVVTSLGPVRLSRSRRYTGPFTPGTVWAIDNNTVAQYLSQNAPLDEGRTLLNEVNAKRTGFLSARPDLGDAIALVAGTPREQGLPCE